MLMGLNLIGSSVVIVVIIKSLRRAKNLHVRQLWLTAAVITGVLISGVAGRLVSQVNANVPWVARPWALVEPVWSVAHPIVAVVAGIVALVRMPAALRSLSEAERVYTTFLRRASSMPSLASLRLTPRESEVVALLRCGSLDDESIADQLGIAPSTAATHVRNIMYKTGTSDRRDLMLLGERAG